MVLTVDFTVAGQPFQGLNGGPDFTFNEAVSFVIECDDQAEVDRLWERTHGGRRRARPVRLAQGPIRPLLAGRAAPAATSCSTIPTRAGRRAMDAMLKMHKIDVAELERAADAA